MIESSQSYAGCRETLTRRLREPAPGRIQLLTGPRQVGKTTLLLELAEGFGTRAYYAAADGPEAALPGFWERLWSEAEARAARGPAVLLIDEIQHAGDWHRRIKGQWDRLRRLKIPLHVVASGSSALSVTAGARESLAGRFERLTLTHWSASALVAAFGLRPDQAAERVVQVGSYPGAMPFANELSRWKAYVRDAIIEPAIGRDILALSAVRRPALLRQVFALATAMPAQIVSLQKLQGQLQDRGALETIAHYLELLEQAYLVVALQKFGRHARRRRAAPPKLVTLNNALLSALHPDGPPDPSDAAERFGAWVENACLAHAWNSGQQVYYWREEPFEVDAVIQGSWGNWAMEIKTGSYVSSDLTSLLEFNRRSPLYRPLLVTARGAQSLARGLGLSAVDWVQFLVEGPPREDGSGATAEVKR